MKASEKLYKKAPYCAIRYTSSLFIKSLYFFSILAGVVEASYASADRLLVPEQAAYDLRHYDVNLTIDADKKMIGGTVIIKVNLVDNLKNMLLDLSSIYSVSSVYLLTEQAKEKLAFEHQEGKIEIDFGKRRSIS